MTDIIAMHRAALVDAVTAAVTPLKAERDALAARILELEKDEMNMVERYHTIAPLQTMICRDPACKLAHFCAVEDYSALQYRYESCTANRVKAEARANSLKDSGDKTIEAKNDRIRALEAALLGWYEESGRSTKQSTWPANLWAMAREIGRRGTVDPEGHVSAVVERIQLRDRVAALEAEIADFYREQARIGELEAALRKLIKGYVNTLESGAIAIQAYGGKCDSVEVMEAGDPHLIEAKAVLTSSETKCPVCGVHYVKGARHFSECLSQPGAETAEDGWICKARGTVNHRNLQCRNRECPSFKNEVAK